MPRESILYSNHLKGQWEDKLRKFTILYTSQKHLNRQSSSCLQALCSLSPLSFLSSTSKDRIRIWKKLRRSTQTSNKPLTSLKSRRRICTRSLAMARSQWLKLALWSATDWAAKSNSKSLYRSTKQPQCSHLNQWPTKTATKTTRERQRQFCPNVRLLWRFATMAAPGCRQARPWAIQ